MVLARYPDRQVNISAKDVSLTDAYWIMSYFVLRKDMKRETVHDPRRPVQARPLDSCRVEAVAEEFHAVGEDQFHVECRSAKRRLKRLRSDGTTRYQQVPLPECATTDNPACVYGPALSVNEFRAASSDGK
ncbi:hypothetical protein GCM10011487_45010 [Steroidobacter agaridevorans]|uniref:Uncharacterized protein n=2 Tax=Steroidobacter agaridevorans TaxID=2695856 RepID=A0A829YI46_9GAMM|nr:hypothetical protein GCM10011487_45010 [Steroidobacter agaridevorans]